MTRANSYNVSGKIQPNPTRWKCLAQAASRSGESFFFMIKLRFILSAIKYCLSLVERGAIVLYANRE